MEFENVDFKATTYFMDETVPAIGVDFLDVSGKRFSVKLNFLAMGYL